MKNTLVLTGASTEYAPLHEVTGPGKEDWATRHGFDFEFVDLGTLTTAEAYWARIEPIARRLETYTRVVWLDCDSFITNPNMPIGCIDGGKTFPVVASIDWGPIPDAHLYWRVSSGNMIFTTSDGINAAKEILEQRLNPRLDHDPDGNNDQAALRFIIREFGYGRALPRRNLNAVPHGAQFGFPQYVAPVEPWQPGDFLCHLSGASNEARFRAIEQLKRLI